MSIEIFEVQSAALAPGVYKCYRQQLLATGWEPGSGDKFDNFDTTVVEVLNVIENDILADYTPALAIGDRIAAWPFKDNLGIIHWVGKPAVPSVRMAQATEDAGDSQEIVCNLIANDGESEIEEGLGSGITVYFRPTDGVDMNSASPRFADLDYLFVENISGRWWYVAAPQANEDCANPP